MTKLLLTILLLLMLVPLADMATAAPLQTTPAGTRCRDLRPGSGEITAPGDIATLHFTGWLDDRGSKGREICNSRRERAPVSYVIVTERVVPGWNDGIVGMQPGGRCLLLVPPARRYGSECEQDVVPYNASLIFIIELLELEKRTENQPAWLNLPDRFPGFRVAASGLRTRFC